MKNRLFPVLALIAMAVVLSSWYPVMNRYYLPQPDGWDEYDLVDDVKELHIRFTDEYVPDNMAVPSLSDEMTTIDIYFSEDGRIDSSLQLPTKWESKYQYVGNMQICDAYYFDELSNRYLTTYTPFGAIDEKMVFDEHGEPIYHEQYFYDLDQHFVLGYRTSSRGYCKETVTNIKYDKQGQAIYSEHYYQYGDNPQFMDITEQFVYDSDGRVIRRTETDRAGSVSVSEYEYDVQGHLTAIWEDGRVTCTYTYEFDDHGNIILVRADFGNNRYETQIRTIVYY